MGSSFSTTSSSTTTFAGLLRPVGGGTCGGEVSTAFTVSPVSAEGFLAASWAGLAAGAARAAASIHASSGFIGRILVQF